SDRDRPARIGTLPAVQPATPAIPGAREENADAGGESIVPGLPSPPGSGAGEGRKCAEFQNLILPPTRPNDGAARPASPLRVLGGRQLGLANGALFAQLGAAAHFGRLFVVFPLTQLFRHAAPFQQLLEAAQCSGNRFTIVNAHT